jgi:hypothetical protein
VTYRYVIETRQPAMAPCLEPAALVLLHSEPAARHWLRRRNTARRARLSCIGTLPTHTPHPGESVGGGWARGQGGGKTWRGLGRSIRLGEPKQCVGGHQAWGEAGGGSGLSCLGECARLQPWHCTPGCVEQRGSWLAPYHCRLSHTTLRERAGGLSIVCIWGMEPLPW